MVNITVKELEELLHMIKNKHSKVVNIKNLKIKENI